MDFVSYEVRRCQAFACMHLHQLPSAAYSSFGLQVLTQHLLGRIENYASPQKGACSSSVSSKKKESHILFISVQWSLLFLSFQSKHLFSNSMHGTHMAILWMPGHQTWKHMTMFVCAILLVLNIHLRDAITGKKVTKQWTLSLPPLAILETCDLCDI